MAQRFLGEGNKTGVTTSQTLPPVLRLSDFDYELPQELIAFYPCERRSESRLMKIERASGKWAHHCFRDIGDFFRPGDLLVLNDTKVIPARLWGRKTTGAKVEVLLVKPRENDGEWEALLRPSGRFKKGAMIFLAHPAGELAIEVGDDPSAGTVKRVIRFSDPDYRRKIWQIGRMPLPPYIRREDEALDRERYQTVFAKNEGAIAAPTAGLHFDETLLEQLRSKGVRTAFLTLHTSYGTFRPVRAENLHEHRMDEEEFYISSETAALIHEAKKMSQRIIACGTTSARALESALRADGQIAPGASRTSLFIRPPFHFRVVDGIITNFHLPKSTLLLLVSAFLGREALFRAYEEAVKQRYRFYSYGDAMVIL